MSTQPETFSFQAEIKQLLDLMIHSLYSNKEIFLRELISNASDAVDKLRFNALSDGALYEGDGELKILVSIDKENKTLSIRDNGIGMTREEVISNIGTIAKSGTKEFFKALTGDQAKDSQLIGQFGVGFYSSFIVADKVTLITRKAGMTSEHGVKWESTGDGSYLLETIDCPQRGTEVILHFKEGEETFLEDFKVRSVIKKYSDHIMLPVMMQKPVFNDEENDEENSEEKPVIEAKEVWETVNSTDALWHRSKSDIKDEEYNEFYKNMGHDYEDPLLHLHTKVEGNLEYTALVFVPTRAPFDLWDRHSRHGVKLYVRRVFIMDDAEHLLPPYLRFMRGVIDSNDLPLNVSRELLQDNKQIEQIRNGVVKKILASLEGMAKNETEKYATFWKQFGRVLKEGILDDQSNKEKVAKLLRYSTTFDDNPEQSISLDDYISRMKEGQEKIYYITAETFAGAKNSPHLEIFRKKGIEVILMAEQVDEWVVNHLSEYNGKHLQSITKGELDLGGLETEEEKEAVKQENEAAKDFVERIKTALGDKIKDVKISNRLTNSPACLVNDQYAMDASLERLLKAAGQAIPSSKPIFEINTHHQLVQGIREESNEELFKDWMSILFDQALLSEGAQLEDPAGFVNRLNALILKMKG
jgi:molecular chaperone HtpG